MISCSQLGAQRSHYLFGFYLGETDSCQGDSGGPFYVFRGRVFIFSADETLMAKKNRMEPFEIQMLPQNKINTCSRVTVDYKKRWTFNFKEEQTGRMITFSATASETGIVLNSFQPFLP